MRDLIRFRRRADQNAVHSLAARPGLCGGYSIAAGADIDRPGAVSLGHGKAVRVQVHTKDLTAGRPQELHGKQADQPEAVYHELLPQRRRQEADPLQADARQNRKGGLFIADGVGDLRAQVLRHANDFRVGAVADDTVSRGESRYTLANFQYNSCVAVAKRQRLVETFEHGIQRGEQSVRLDLVQDLLDLVGLTPGLGKEGPLGEFHEHSLRPC